MMFEQKVTASKGAWTLVRFSQAVAVIVAVAGLINLREYGVMALILPIAVVAISSCVATHLLNLTIRIDDTHIWLRADDHIPLDKIISCDITDRDLDGLPKFYNATRLVTERGIFYVVPGKLKRLVQLHLESGDYVLFSADDPEAVVDAILERRPQARREDDYVPAD